MSENANANMGKNTRKFIIVVAVAAILLIVASNAFFYLEEGESALVQRFGRIESVYMREASNTVRTQIENRGVSLHIGTGLKLKVPFIDNVIKYPSKLILYDSPPTEVLTLDRHRLYFDNTAQWRIENPLLFYEAHNNINNAKRRIDDVLYSEMRISVGRLNSYVLISDRELSGQMLLDMADAVNANFTQRGEGISIVDIRIKRTDLPSETYNSIYNRMNTERQRVAAEYRSEGDEILLDVVSQTDRAVISITSQAERQAEEIRGEGDSEAARIYNEAYGRDPEFFEFYNLLDTYRLTVGNRSTLIVPLDSPFAKYLLGITPGAAQAVAAPPVIFEE
ncbi:MAG: protease modulator HflC [Oscillospiraceae bacterium]|jgi:membrane protease subunit HflC|nr:protease modulator HflC [Oscillospiraceae bacterium]